MNVIRILQRLLNTMRGIDFLAPLALRLYLVPIFWMVGTGKLSDIESTAEWLGNRDWGLGLPFPELMAWLAASTETAGAILLVLGLAVRWIYIPLMVTMIVAIVSVHWQHGWQAIADTKFCLFNCSDAQEAAERLAMARGILKEHGNYDVTAAMNGSSKIRLASKYSHSCSSKSFCACCKCFSIREQASSDSVSCSVITVSPSRELQSPAAVRSSSICWTIC